MIDWAALPDDELLARVVGGTGGSWDELMRRYQRLVVGCVRKVLRRYRAFVSDEGVLLRTDVICSPPPCAHRR